MMIRSKFYDQTKNVSFHLKRETNDFILFSHEKRNLVFVWKGTKFDDVNSIDYPNTILFLFLVNFTPNEIKFIIKFQQKKFCIEKTKKNIQYFFLEWQWH